VLTSQNTVGIKQVTATDKHKERLSHGY